MQREGSVIGEAVECPPTWRRQCASQQAVGTLVEEGAGLLPVPGRGQVANAALADIDLAWYGTARQYYRLLQALAPAHGRVVPEQNAVGVKHVVRVPR